MFQETLENGIFKNCHTSWIAVFPQLIAGPRSRIVEFLKQKKNSLIFGMIQQNIEVEHVQHNYGMVWPYWVEI